MEGAIQAAARALDILRPGSRGLPMQEKVRRALGYYPSPAADTKRRRELDGAR